MKSGSGSRKNRGSSSKKQPQEIVASVETIIINDVDELSSIKQKILNNFLKETAQIRENHDGHQAEARKRFEELEGLLHEQAKGSEEKQSLLDQINDHKKQLAKFANETNEQKKEMRGEIVKLEDELRRMRDRLAEIEIENQCYEVLGDAEKQMREAREEAELKAAQQANDDLNQHVRRLKKEVDQGQQNQNQSQRQIDDLQAKYN